jgi:sugar/nucleoside kinase (ribokinase family)
MEQEVLCIGFCCVDVLIRGLGEIDRSREGIPAEKITMWIGGDAMNEAYVLKHLGNRVKLLTGLADDGAAKFIRAVLDEAGIDYSLSYQMQDSDTTIACPVVFQDAERSIINAGLSDSLRFMIDPATMPKARVVSLASLFMPPLDKPQQVLEVARQAKANGSIVCADMMWTEGVSNLETFREVWQYIDYFFPNEDEAAKLTGKDDPEEMAKTLLDYGVGCVVIKVGKQGCLATNRKGAILVPPYLVKAKDTTGAGDNFAAGFITGLMDGQDLKNCCRYANAAASIAIQFDGASTGIRSRAQLDAVLKSGGENP